MTLLRYFSVSLSAVSLVVYNVFAKNISNMLNIKQNPLSISSQIFNIMYESALCCSLVSNLLQVVLGSDETFNVNMLKKSMHSISVDTRENKNGEKTKGFVSNKLPLITNISIIITHVIMSVWSWIMTNRQIPTIIGIILCAGMIIFNAVPVFSLCFSHPSETPKRLSSLTLFVRRMFFRTLIVSPMCVFEAVLICSLPIFITTMRIEDTGTNNCFILPMLSTFVAGLCIFIGIVEREFGASLVSFVFASANAALHRSTGMSCGEELSISSLSLMILTGSIALVLSIRSIIDMSRYTNYYRTTKDIQHDLQKATESLNLHTTIELANISLNSQLANGVKTPSGGLIKTIRAFREKRATKKLKKESNDKNADVIQKENNDTKEKDSKNHHKYDNGMSITDKYLEVHEDNEDKKENEPSTDTTEDKKDVLDDINNKEGKEEGEECKEFMDTSGFVIMDDDTFKGKGLVFKKDDKQEGCQNNKEDRVITCHSNSSDDDDQGYEGEESAYEEDNGDKNENSNEEVKGKKPRIQNDNESGSSFGRSTIIMVEEKHKEDDVDNKGKKSTKEVKLNCVKDLDNLDPIIRSTLSPNFDVNLINGGIDPSMTLSSMMKQNDSTSFEYKVNNTININRTLTPSMKMDSIRESEDG